MVGPRAPIIASFNADGLSQKEISGLTTLSHGQQPVEGITEI